MRKTAARSAACAFRTPIQKTLLSPAGTLAGVNLTAVHAHIGHPEPEPTLCLEDSLGPDATRYQTIQRTRTPAPIRAGRASEHCRRLPRPCGLVRNRGAVRAHFP